jgi:putative ABC transport system permease protein
MSFLSLILVNLGRNRLRTTLTMLSVTVALFLFCMLGGVLDTLTSAIKVGSETRLITRNAISLVFPLPIAYRDRIAALPGVQDVGYANWFGGQDPKDPHNFFQQLAVSDNYLPMYTNDIDIVAASPPQAAVPLPAGTDPKLAAYLAERTACVVGEKLMQRMSWSLGQTVTLKGTIYPGDWPFTIRAIYRSKTKSMRDESMYFHWKYLEERGMGGQGLAGDFVFKLSDPDRAAAIARQVDALFENSAYATHTETERAFIAGFISMYGNLPFVLRIIGFAVVFSILLIAANTMMTSFRERITEIGVLKTLGFSDRAVFGLVLAEAAVITLGGGLAGALLARLLLDGRDLRVLPPMVLDWSNVGFGLAIAALLGAVSGLLPAWQASRLRIVAALRRV